MSRPETHHETSDLYHRVIAQLSPSLRVVECKDLLQWIIQQRKKGGAKRPWRGVSYHTTRNALIRCCAKLETRTEAISWATLEALPEYFPRRAANGSR